MGQTIVILEDEQPRMDRFIPTIQAIDTELKIVRWFDAHTMVREVDTALSDACLISLDHDLYIGEDPGDGMDVANHLATLTRCCPVIVHSSNTDRGRAMVGELEYAGWQCHRVLPFGDDWVETEWCNLVKSLIGN
jgi:hypothetical protein